MDRHLIDYTVRNLTTGDGEEERVLELEHAEFVGFPEYLQVGLEGIVQAARANPALWLPYQDVILAMLKPHISEPALYERDYTAWERIVLGDDDTQLHSHECRRCSGSIPCRAAETRNGCTLWNGDNDGCIETPHSADCRDGYRCPVCYAAA